MKQHHKPNRINLDRLQTEARASIVRDHTFFTEVVYNGLSEEEVAGKYDTKTADVLKACLRHHAWRSEADKAQGSYYVVQASEGEYPRFKIKYDRGFYTDEIGKSPTFTLRDAYLKAEELGRNGLTDEEYQQRKTQLNEAGKNPPTPKE